MLDGHIYVAGGYNGTKTINEVECYSDEKKEWYDCYIINILK